MNTLFGKLNKTHGFFAFGLILFAFVGYKALPYKSCRKIKAVITSNHADIKALNQERREKLVLSAFYNTLDFPQHESLRHKNKLPVGFGRNFFIDFSAQLSVNSAGEYKFLVNSDDGFSVKIDGTELVSRINDGTHKNIKFNTILTEGKHLFELSYFQRFGPAGIQVSYIPPKSAKSFPLGKNSSELEFVEFDKND